MKMFNKAAVYEEQQNTLLVKEIEFLKSRKK